MKSCTHSAISDGEAGALVGFEPSETIRAISKCNADSVVIANTSPVPPYTVAQGKAEYPDVKTTFDEIARRVNKFIAFDATALALQAGTGLSLNIVMLGALAQTGRVPLDVGLLRQAIREKIKPGLVDTNLMAFDLGFEAAAKVV